MSFIIKCLAIASIVLFSSQSFGVSVSLRLCLQAYDKAINCVLVRPIYDEQEVVNCFENNLKLQADCIKGIQETTAQDISLTDYNDNYSQRNICQHVNFYNAVKEAPNVIFYRDNLFRQDRKSKYKEEDRAFWRDFYSEFINQDNEFYYRDPSDGKLKDLKLNDPTFYFYEVQKHFNKLGNWKYSYFIENPGLVEPLDEVFKDYCLEYNKALAKKEADETSRREREQGSTIRNLKQNMFDEIDRQVNDSYNYNNYKTYTMVRILSDLQSNAYSLEHIYGANSAKGQKVRQLISYLSTTSRDVEYTYGYDYNDQIPVSRVRSILKEIKPMIQSL